MVDEPPPEAAAVEDVQQDGAAWGGDSGSPEPDQESPPEAAAAEAESGTDQDSAAAEGQPQDASANDSGEPVPEPESASEPVPAALPATAKTIHFRANNRAEALSLLGAVSAYYQKAEPASPIPFLIERARRFAQSDFIGLLRDVLPADALTDTAEKKD